MRGVVLLSLCLTCCVGVTFFEAAAYASTELKNAINTFCVNENPSCAEWAEEGECQKNPGYMQTACREACRTCQMGGNSDFILYGLRAARKLLSRMPAAKAKALQARVEDTLQGVFVNRHFSEPRGVLESASQLLDEVLGSVSEADESPISVGGLSSTPSSLNSTVRLNNDVLMPRIGFGIWQLGGEAVNTIQAAIEAGYRHFDAAQGYGNEAELGKAVKNSGIPRSEFFLATKVSVEASLGQAAIRSLVQTQLKDLQTDYIDLYMFHGFFGDNNQRRETWRELEKMYDEGVIKALGVSNYDVAALEDILSYSRIPPTVVQNKFSPFRVAGQYSHDAQVHVAKFAPEKGIVIVGYSVVNPWPFQLPVLRDPFVLAVAQASNRTPAQVVHRWALQHGVAIIPRSSDPARMRDSLHVLDFELDETAMQTIDGLNWFIACDSNVPTYADTFGLADMRMKTEL